MSIKKKPWPTKDAMEQIYRDNLWGGHDKEYYSGEGSHQPSFVIPYVNVVRSFLTSFDQPLRVCDLGCGDFNIGNKLVENTQAYFAIDIVESLIERNKHTFQTENLEFKCQDIVRDKIPEADCAILRQVLQHLSNSEVKSITQKLHKFKYILITEHLPDGPFEPNLDIISGQGTRLKKGSGVDLLSPPFNLQVRSVVKLLSIPLGDGRGRVDTVLYHL